LEYRKVESRGLCHAIGGAHLEGTGRNPVRNGHLAGPSEVITRTESHHKLLVFLIAGYLLAVEIMPVDILALSTADSAKFFYV
jgi:hypothetical protein